MGAPTADAPIITKKQVKEKEMKRLLGYLFAALAVAVLSVGCHKATSGDVTGQIDEITDSVMIVKIDGSKVRFDITECAFTNGAVMYGDSVIVSFDGELGSRRCMAKTCYLIQKSGNVVVVTDEPDTTKELMTREADKKTVEGIDNLVRIAKKRNAK